jgi:hypothetical protein
MGLIVAVVAGFLYLLNVARSVADDKLPVPEGLYYQ